VTETSRATIEALVRRGAYAAAEKKATDVMALDVGATLVVTDYFLIATGANDRQVHAISDSVEDALREAGARPIGREGERELKWVLLDKLWSDAPRLSLPVEVVNASKEAAPEDPS
jgi:ribosome-associated protein